MKSHRLSHVDVECSCVKFELRFTVGGVIGLKDLFKSCMLTAHFRTYLFFS